MQAAGIRTTYNEFVAQQPGFADERHHSFSPCSGPWKNSAEQRGRMKNYSPERGFWVHGAPLRHASPAPSSRWSPSLFQCEIVPPPSNLLGMPRLCHEWAPRSSWSRATLDRTWLPPAATKFCRKGNGELLAAL